METVRDAVKRLGDYWYTSKQLRSHGVAVELERAIHRPDLKDLWAMRAREYRKGN